MGAEAYAEVQLENEHFKVTKWTIEPGAAIPMHRHEYEYVVIPLVTDTMHVTNGDGGEFMADLTAGQSYTRPAGVEHKIENRTSQNAVVFVEVEKMA
jgi:quercetin dioxygenase-like cupin family protein